MLSLEPFTTTPSISGTVAGLAADVTGRIDDRPPLLLLHGLTFDRRLWQPTLAELRALDPDRRTFAVDLPGHGESPDAPAYDLTSMAERVRRVVVEGGLVDPVLVGHSASAAVVAIYASQFPTSGIVEVEGGFDVGPFAGLVQSFPPGLLRTDFDAVWARVSGAAFRLDEVSPDVRAFVAATSRPRANVVLGNWRDLIERPVDELEA